MAEKLFEFLRLHSIHPNDVSIISDDIKLLREIDYLIRKQFNEKTLTTFETKEILEKIQQDNSNPNISKKIVDNVRKKKKYSFNLNNGTVKLSTIHSFKGCEAPTLCLVIDKKNDELTYTAMTRSRENLIIFDIGGIYSDFFDRNI
jgi:superfamily I DNA/RNA helicase